MRSQSSPTSSETPTRSRLTALNARAQMKTGAAGTSGSAWNSSMISRSSAACTSREPGRSWRSVVERLVGGLAVATGNGAIDGMQQRLKAPLTNALFEAHPGLGVDARKG